MGPYDTSLSDTSVLRADCSSLTFSWLASPGVGPLRHKLGQGSLGLQHSHCSAPEVELLLQKQRLGRRMGPHGSTALA